jgi:hypothetical protein
MSTLFQGGSAVQGGPGLGNELRLGTNEDFLLSPTSSGATNLMDPLIAIPILGRNPHQKSWVMNLGLPASGTSCSIRAAYEDLGIVPGARGILLANNGAGTFTVTQNRTNFAYQVSALRNAFLPLFMAPEMIDLTFTNASGFANCSAMLTSEEMVPFSI